MVMKKSYMIILAALLAAGCAKDNDADMPQGIEDNVSFAASLSGDGTRVSYTDEGSTVKLGWYAGDKIGIFAKCADDVLGTNVPYAAKSAGAESDFEWTESKIRWADDKAAHDFYAYYPYSADAGEDFSAVLASVPAEQKVGATSTSHLAAYDFMYAVTENAVKDDKGVGFLFKHVFSILNVRLTANMTVDVERLVVRFKEEQEVLSAEGVKIDLATGKTDYSEAETTNQVALVGQTLVSKGVDTDVYLVVVPGHAGKTMEIAAVVNGKEQVVATKTLSDAGIPAGKAAVVSGTITVSDEDAKQVVNLSKYGTANCYLVNRAGADYKFRADVMGNGASTPNITPETLAPAAVRLYKQYIPSGNYKGGTEDGWGDDEMNKLILKNSVKLLEEDGVPYVFFSTPQEAAFSAGNAVICATDASGAIIWSWHIWVAPDYALGMGDVAISANDKCNGVVMMNRNLGALSSGPNDNTEYDAETNARAAVGMAYQWGRKDPFVYVGVTQLKYNCINGYMQEADGTVKKIRNDGEVYGVWSNAAPVSMTAEEAPTVADAVKVTIANPNTRYKFHGAGSYFSPWAAPLAEAQQNDLYKSLWGNPTRADGVGSGVKTIYDPCPVGYRVPDADAYRFFTGNGADMNRDNILEYNLNFDKTATPFVRDGDKITGVNLDSSFGFHFYTASALSDGQTDADRADKTTIFFPAYQCIYYTAETRLNESVDAFTPREKYMGHCVYVSCNKAEWQYPSGMFFSMDSDKRVFSYSGYHIAAGALSVRCIKE